MQINPAKYWRRNKDWSQWLGRRGEVEVSTRIKVASEEFFPNQPYSFVLVKFEQGKKEFVGVGHDQFEPGDRVEVVLRRQLRQDAGGLIDYRLKVKKLQK